MLPILLVSYTFNAYKAMLFLRILGSWVPELQGSAFMRFVRQYTDPYLDFFRQFIPPLGMIDISPIVAFFSLTLIQNYVAMPLVLMLMGAFH